MRSELEQYGRVSGAPAMAPPAEPLRAPDAPGASERPGLAPPEAAREDADGDPGLRAFVASSIRVLRLLPRNLVSYLIGFLARLRLPQPLAGMTCRAFVDAVGIDLSDAAAPLSAYRTIEDVFTRRLAAGARPIEGAFVSPVDAVVTQAGPLVEGQILQAKGSRYRLAELLDRRVETDGAWTISLLLGPSCYHRVHAPWSGRLRAVRAVPGDLWPLTEPYRRLMPRLFARSERLIFDFELDGGDEAALVMVGALLVGRMFTAFAPELTTNVLDRVTGGGRPLAKRLDRRVEVGEEIGRFMLGSTVVLVLDPRAAARLTPYDFGDGDRLRVGRSLTRAASRLALAPPSRTDAC
jgi:phosphatidylserine decarboxylase